MPPRRLLFGYLKTLVGLGLVASLSASLQATSPVLPAARPSLTIDGLGKGTAPLNGPWQFHLGDSPAWAAPGIDDSTGHDGWEQLTADQPWGVQGHENYTGFAWYRRHITFQTTADPAPEVALLLQNVDDAYELYWNGVPIGHFGKLPPRPVLYFDQQAQTFDLGKPQSGVLAVRVWMPMLLSSDPGDGGGFETLPILGTTEGIAARRASLDYEWLRERQISFGLNSLYVLIGLLSLMAWLRDRSQWILFWMALFCSYSPLNLLILQLRFPWPANIEFGLMQPVYALGDVALWFLLLWLLELRDKPTLLRFVRIASLAILTNALLDGVVASLGWTSDWTIPAQASDAILTTINIFLESVPIVLVIFAVSRSKSLNSTRWLLAMIALLDQMVTVVANAASQGIRFTHWTLSNTLQQPIFTMNGASVNPIKLGNTLLLFVLVYAIYRNMVENRNRQRLLEQEFQSARELQQILVPETLPALPGFRMTSAYKPALEVGGDFFQIIPLEDGCTLIVLGDVSGKGLKAAMSVSLIVGALRMLAEITTSPAEILAGLNRRLYDRLQGGFATCVALRLQPDGECVIASAGHLSPFLNDEELDLPGALPLGLIPTADYEETSVRIQAGDHFILYTDGLLEARDHSGQLFGFERLQTLIATKPDAAQATQAAVSFGQDDDITVITLTRSPLVAV